MDESPTLINSEISPATRPPVIIIGMHRSGTSLITRILEGLGLFVGRDLERNHESRFFIRLNKWLLYQSGGRWFTPHPIELLIGSEKLRERASEHLLHMVSSLRVSAYSGIWNRLIRGSPLNTGEPWGWKDPRTTVTLPLWLDIFPNARVIHVIRHGVDVAASLARRDARFTRSKAGLAGIRSQLKSVIYPEVTPNLWECLPCRSLDRGIDLWDYYVSRGRIYSRDLGDRYCEVRYEAVLNDPIAGVEKVAEFAGIQFDEESIQKEVQRVDRDRAFRYRQDPRLRAFADDHEGQLNEVLCDM